MFPMHSQCENDICIMHEMLNIDLMPINTGRSYPLYLVFVPLQVPKLSPELAFTRIGAAALQVRQFAAPESVQVAQDVSQAAVEKKMIYL